MVFVLAEEQLSKEQEVTASNQQKMEQWRCYYVPLCDTLQRRALYCWVPPDRIKDKLQIPSFSLTCCNEFRNSECVCALTAVCLCSFIIGRGEKERKPQATPGSHSRSLLSSECISSRHRIVDESIKMRSIFHAGSLCHEVIATTRQ